MDATGDSNYTAIHQHLQFQEAKTPIQVAATKRECLIHSYTSSLNLLDCEDSIELLKTNLTKYSEAIDGSNKNIYEGFLPIKNFNDNVKSPPSLHSVNIDELLKPLPCSALNSFKCQKDKVDEESVRQLSTLFNQTPVVKQNTYKEQPVKKIAKNFLSHPATVKSNVADFAPNVPVEDPEEEKPSFAFKSAREELQIQNMKKFGTRSSSQTQLNAGGQKRKLGTRRNFQNKFVSPMLSNNSSEELPQLNQEVDERLKNIDPQMVELIRSEIMDNGAIVHWDDIAGLQFAKTAIQEAVVWPLLRPDIFTGLRRPPKGILLFGPPGTGKTLIGKCVASQSKSTFFSISASSLTSKWIGDGEKMVRALFAVARCHQPAVVFIDEIDSLLQQRSDTEHESSRRMKTEFLVQLDGATTDSEDRILVIGATNRPQELDEAARRRFVKRLYIPLPEHEARLQLVTKLMATEKHNLSDGDIQEIARLSDGYSGADMKNLCSEASLGPIRSIDMSLIQSIQSTEVRPVIMDDFMQAFSRVKASVSPNDLDRYLVWNKTFGSTTSF